MAIPTKRVITFVVVICDECKASIQVNKSCRESELVSLDNGTHDLPYPWREVEMKGWVGVMHACSDDCEISIRSRHEDITPTQVTPIPEMMEVDEDDEDTVS